MACACFYCNAALVRSNRWQGRQPDNLRTTDHIFPKSAVKRLSCLFGDEWRQLNCVDACPACNARKGSMSPLAWLPLIPDPAARLRFLLRLAALGVTPAALARALRDQPRS